ncbi:MAG: NAD(P)/FAD-dependent oxidoreductase [Solirubrobacteraceae bacterium]|nr:NAD(P)/FAD-dependent oxidoreductase [Patulibacter sp.]
MSSTTATATEPEAHGTQPVRDTQVLVIGAGVSGIAVVVALRKKGITDFTIIEAGAEVGGTWRDNTYPGCGCDVPSLLYSFSFEQNPNWTRTFAKQPEIQAYVRGVARKHGIDTILRSGVEATASRWDDDQQRWIVETTEGTYRAQFIVGATGPLQHAKIPDIPGLDGFTGKIFHSAQWDHDYDLAGKRVAVVGTGASAIQIVPTIQPTVSELVLLQRTPSWVLPRPDFKVGRVSRLALRYVPGLQRGIRIGLWLFMELQQQAQRRPKLMQQLQKLGLGLLKRQVKDPELRRALTPTFTLGCKRLMMSNTYYKALTAPNATVVPHALAEVKPGSVVGADGSEHEVDAIIFATGFHVTDPPIADAVRGRSGKTVAESWGPSPQAYLGTMAPDIPNAFLMVGPNLGNGHTSVFLPIEAQAGYIADAISTARAAGVEAIEVRRDIHQRWNDKVQKALEGTVWNDGGCASYYLDSTGRNSTIYPWTTIDLRRRMRHFKLDQFHTARKGEHLPS